MSEKENPERTWEKIVLAGVSFGVGFLSHSFLIIGAYVLGGFIFIFMLNYYRWKKSQRSIDSMPASLIIGEEPK